MTKTNRATLLLLALFLTPTLWAQDTSVYFAPDPGVAKADANQNAFSVSNTVLSMSWRLADGHVQGAEFKDQLAHRAQAAQAVPFSLILGDGSVLPASSMKMVAAPKVVTLDAYPDAARLAE